jgi:hypothetical protein
MIKSKRMRWTRPVACMVKTRSAYKIMVGKPDVKRRPGRTRPRWEDNTKMNLREIGWVCMDWMHPVEDRSSGGLLIL